MTSNSPIEIFSDGGAIGNPGKGGYGAVIRVDGVEREISAGYRFTTNNRMELMGVIASLDETADIGARRHTVVTTDSRYVVDAVEKGWAANWRANDWMRNRRDQASNTDLWEKLLRILDRRRVAFRWVKGHSGHRMNERADRLVREASKVAADRLLEDHGFTGSGGDTVMPRLPDASATTSEPKPDLASPTPDDHTDSADDNVTRSLTHIDSSGEARMIDVGDKAMTERIAVASCEVLMSPATLIQALRGEMGKGDVISVAKLAGVMAAKRTADLIPMCHNIPLSQVEVKIDPLSADRGLRVIARARAKWRTGVEMEAMTAASVAALTVYDMCKSAERGIVITELRLRRKSGGKSGDYVSD